MTDRSPRAIAADPRWFPLRYDPQRDEIQFAWLPREAHRAIGFLTDEEATAAAPRLVIDRKSLHPYLRRDLPLHLILHSGLTGSTLLARALDREGAVMTWKEPPIMGDIVRHRLTRPGPEAAAAVLDDIASLLARPFEPGEAVIAKVVSTGNGLGAEIARRTSDSRILCLHAPLEIFLESVARKGLWGRLWGRKLFIGLHNSGIAELGFTSKDLFEQTDLQLAACAWLAMHRIFSDVARTFGTQRVRSLDSETLFADVDCAVAAVADHFNPAIEGAPLSAGALSTRHAKTGQAYDPEVRARELEQARAAFGEEITMVVEWARKVADVQGIPWALQAPLYFAGGQATDGFASRRPQ